MLKADPPDLRGTAIILHFLTAFSRRFCAGTQEMWKTFGSPKRGQGATLSPEVMNEFQVIESALKGAARRRRGERAWRGFWQGLLAGGLIWLLTIAAYKIFPLPAGSLLAGGIAAAVVALAGLILAAGRRISLAETARWVDARKQLQERLSTALELAAAPGAGEWKDLLVRDAARHAKDLDPRQLLPFRLPMVSRWALLVVALGTGLGFVPEYRSREFVQKQKDAANIRDAGKQLAELTRQRLAQRPPVLEPTLKAMEAVAEVGDKLDRSTLTRSEALRDLTSVTDKLAQQTKELEKNPALKPLERAARESTTGGTPSPDDLQKQIDALQKSLGSAAGDPDKLDKLQKQLQQLQQAAANLPDKNAAASSASQEQMSQALSELSKKAQELGASLPGLEEAIAALQANQTDLFLKDLDAALNDLDKLKQMAKAMQQLQQQMAKLGKDLAEQLKNGQAQVAQATLQKMIEQLQSASLTKEQLQKIMEEVSAAAEPGSEYGKVGDYLRSAAGQMQKGQKPDAAQNLAAAAKELDKLLQQMSDAESLQAALDALDQAQLAIASGKGWSECKRLCRFCNGAGCSHCRGWRHGGRAGAGVGTWADEGQNYLPEDAEAFDNSGIVRPDMDPRGHTDRPDDLNPDLAPTKVRGQISPGGSMPSITLKGVSIKGTSSVKYQEAAASAQAEAQAALNQDLVPRAYQGAVRDYFDDLKK